MEQVEVRTTPDAMVEIIQRCGGMEPADVFIRLHPDQIPVLKQWLDEAVDEVRAAITGPAAVG
jgi:hypothetical protein